MSHFGFATSSKLPSLSTLGIVTPEIMRRMNADRMSPGSLRSGTPENPLTAGSPRTLLPETFLDALRAAIVSTSRDGVPFNIVQVEDDVYEIELALAGFKEDEISISVKDRHLVVEGKVADKTERTYLHRGLAMRDFKHGFTLGQYLEVKGAEFVDGLLRIRCVREVPEAAKPRQIEITRKL